MDENPQNFPRHVAIIMDGNGRWAKARHLPRVEGHRQGTKAVRRLVEALANYPIEQLTLYAFSVENWQRPEGEVRALMDMLVRFLREETQRLVRNRIRFEVVGRIGDLGEEVRKAIDETRRATAAFTERTLALALCYGSRTEAVDAVAACFQAWERGELTAPPASFEDLRPFLYTGEMPDPDLVIRTSGEWRVSNFLLLQAAYAEFYFTPVLWPDFREEDFAQALESYRKRERRFGRTGDQLRPLASTSA